MNFDHPFWGETPLFFGSTPIWTFQRVLHFMCAQYLSLFYPTQFWCFRAVQPPLLFFGIYSETAQYVSPVVMASCYQT